MKDKKQVDGPAKLIVPRLTLDPDLAEDLRNLLRDARPYDLGRPPEYDPRPWTGVFAPLRKETAAAAFGWLVIWSPSVDSHSPLSAWTLASLQWGSLAVGGGVVVLWAAGAVVARKNDRTRLRRLRDARPHYVLAADLADDAGQLLARASTAASAVLKSAVHKEDLVDRQRNETSLPVQEWEIAAGLREYSRLVQAEPKEAEGEKVVALLDSRRRALALSLAGIERRVIALEAYAAQIKEADRQYAELRQIQQLADGSNDVLELLARTARDDLAVAEIEGMTGEAAAVSASFTAALESAKEAAVIALPARKTA
ncbi:hypothetical protein [Streptomyces sp. MJM1172]|uniref:hypothetical protein n=1 Tax=Streptomyces sp. MJM1172 TaxID=1703926 RepID=UPI0009402A89|nr:hypothetical protein [Streptomyces sp. MJM1172]OKI50330.1 hypothetical protein AMK15_32765 [Streptomyces sp. MJM1172]